MQKFSRRAAARRGIFDGCWRGQIRPLGAPGRGSGGPRGRPPPPAPRARRGRGGEAAAPSARQQGNAAGTRRQGVENGPLAIAFLAGHGGAHRGRTSSPPGPRTAAAAASHARRRERRGLAGQGPPRPRGGRMRIARPGRAGASLRGGAAPVLYASFIHVSLETESRRTGSAPRRSFGTRVPAAPAGAAARWRTEALRPGRPPAGPVQRPAPSAGASHPRGRGRTLRHGALDAGPAACAPRARRHAARGRRAVPAQDPPRAADGGRPGAPRPPAGTSRGSRRSACSRHPPTSPRMPGRGGEAACAPAHAMRSAPRPAARVLRIPRVCRRRGRRAPRSEQAAVLRYEAASPGCPARASPPGRADRPCRRALFARRGPAGLCRGAALTGARVPAAGAGTRRRVPDGGPAPSPAEPPGAGRDAPAAGIAAGAARRARRVRNCSGLGGTARAAGDAVRTAPACGEPDGAHGGSGQATHPGRDGASCGGPRRPTARAHRQTPACRPRACGPWRLPGAFAARPPPRRATGTPVCRPRSPCAWHPRGSGAAAPPRAPW